MLVSHDQATSESTGSNRKSTRGISPYSLAQNHPNPFNQETEIQYELPTDSEVEISIYYLRGQQILVLFEGEQGAGRHDVIWNGRNDGGVEAAGGVYLVRMETSEFVLVKKMVLAR